MLTDKCISALIDGHKINCSFFSDGICKNSECGKNKCQDFQTVKALEELQELRKFTKQDTLTTEEANYLRNDLRKRTQEKDELDRKLSLAIEELEKHETVSAINVLNKIHGYVPSKKSNGIFERNNPETANTSNKSSPNLHPPELSGASSLQRHAPKKGRPQTLHATEKPPEGVVKRGRGRPRKEQAPPRNTLPW